MDKNKKKTLTISSNLKKKIDTSSISTGGKKSFSVEKKKSFKGNKNIKRLTDFADLSSDELIGGFDEIKGKKIRIEGYLEEFSLSRKEADELIMSAREIAYK